MTPNHSDISLDDFDDLMAEAAGQKPAKPKLTSYGPVTPPTPPLVVPPPLPVHQSYQPYQPYQPPIQNYAPLPHSVVAQPIYYPVADPMPRHSAAIHALLFFTTGGIGNVFYGLYVMGKKEAWRQRHGFQ